jgi:formylglycine-generating enzyme required for sulfatase activity
MTWLMGAKTTVVVREGEAAANGEQRRQRLRGRLLVILTVVAAFAVIFPLWRHFKKVGEPEVAARHRPKADESAAAPLILAPTTQQQTVNTIQPSSHTAEVHVPRGVDLAEYVGAAQCAECHREIYDRQTRSRKANGLATGGDFYRRHGLPLPAELNDQATGWRYRVAADGDLLQLEVSKGNESARVDMDYAVGSGQRGLTFVRDLDADHYQQLRLSYYADSDSWDITPGLEGDHPATAAEALGPLVPKRSSLACLPCHASKLVQDAGKIDPDRSRFGVNCERCHGPGLDHVTSARAGGALKKMRAPSLSAALSRWQRARDGQRGEDPRNQLLQLVASANDERLIRDAYVCGECHGLHRMGIPADDLRLSRFHFPALLASRCYQESATKLRCTDCHDPHGDSVHGDERHSVAVCIQCHSVEAAASADESASPPPQAKTCPQNPRAGCITCHMPSRTPMYRARFTHHRIGIYRDVAAIGEPAPSGPQDSAKAQNPRPKTDTLNPRSKIQNPKSVAGWCDWPADAPQPAISPFDSAQANKHQQQWADYLKLPLEYTNSIGMKFVLIPPGEFTMGSTAVEIEQTLKQIDPSDKYWQESVKSESPAHHVVLTQPLYLAVHEVTQKEYETVMGKNPSYFAKTGPDPYWIEKLADIDTGNHPVEGVSWNDATEFCAQLSKQEGLKPFYLRAGETVTPLDGTGYRLPTEAEWEFACRAGTTTRFWCGDNEVIPVGWFGGNSGGRTHEVEELSSNAFGLFDVLGNVWEWVQDASESTYYQRCAPSAINPVCQFSAGRQRVLRGGDWLYGACNSRSSVRLANAPSNRFFSIGFRVGLLATTH